MNNWNGVLNHVLIVDDDPLFRAIAETHFKKRGAAKVSLAADGVEALALINGGDVPSYMLCDLNMPKMDGVEFLRHLESIDYGGAITIVSGEAWSVVAVAERIGHSHDLNIVGSLRKPLKANEIDRQIVAAAERRVGSSKSASNLMSVSDLRHAIVSGYIKAHYQPKVDVRTGRIAGAEALARWEHPELGMIHPGHFIPVAEQNGLIDMLTAVVLQAAILDVWRWTRSGMDFQCSVNLSVLTLDNIDFPDQVTACIDAAGLDHSRFIFEVTESSILKKEVAPMEVLTRLRLKGFGLSIDDFGTGNSNFEQLRDFPFSELKIDRSFVSQMLDQPFAKQCVVTSVELGKKLGLQLVAEGVESEELRDAVVKLGVDCLQGWLFGMPMTADKFGRLLDKQNAVAPAQRRQAGWQDRASTRKAS